MNHYHIRWGDGTLDWEAFRNEENAQKAANSLVLDGETYAIEQLDGNCSRCHDFEKRMRMPERRSAA
jgi:hypothetical protein